MRGPRLSLAGLLGIVAVFALGLAGLASATAYWTSAAATVTLALLLAAALGAILLRGAERAFCLGFTLFGGAYLALVEWDWIGGPFGHDLTAGLSETAEALFPDRPTPTPFGTPVVVPVEAVRARQIKMGNFIEISRCTLALIFAALGGALARALDARREDRDRRPSHPPDPRSTAPPA